MIKLRLKRFGKKREVSYRIVAMKNTDRRDGRPLEEIGFYNPRTDETRLDVPAIVKYLQQGAQPTKTVKHLLEKPMSLSKSAPNLDTPVATDVSTGVSNKSQPDFVGIVRFLVAPFLTASTALSVDCEYRANGSRVWIRLAFDGEDRGRVLGRGGRNIQAIRTVIKAIAALSGLQAHLEVYGESSARPEREENGPDRPARSQLPRPKKAN